MGWRREFQAGIGGCGRTPASTPLGGAGGYRRAEGGGGPETRRVWGEFWGVKFEENAKGDDGKFWISFLSSRRVVATFLADSGSHSSLFSRAGENVLTPCSLVAADLAEKLNRLEGGAGEQENPYFVGAVVA